MSKDRQGGEEATASSPTRTGGCLCGAVRYRVPAAPLRTVACHCRDCQKQSGGPMSVIAVYRHADFEIDVAIKGTLRPYESTGSSGLPVIRWFCGRCGAPIYSQTAEARAADVLLVKAGTLDDVSDLEPSVHYWAASRQPWLELPAGARTRGRQ